MNRLSNKLLFSIVSLLLGSNLYAQDVSQLIPQIKDAIVTIHAQDVNHETFASGSGFFISSNGIGVTNFHVLQGASYGSVICTNGQEYAIESIIDYSPKFDLVKFKIKNPSSQPLPFLKTQTAIPLQGSMVVSYSNPLGSFENTVSTGVVAAIRDYSGYEKVLQITAPISHGSSGSPVMNNLGEVLGIATFGIESGQSLNFAVSIQQLDKMKRNLQIPVANMQENELETPNLKQGNSLAAMGRLDAAMQLFNKEIESNPQNHLAYYLRGLWMCRAGRYNPGIYDLLNACQMDTMNYMYFDKTAEFMKNLVIQGFDSGVEVPQAFLESAANSYQRCMALDPNRPDAYAGLGYMMLYIGKMSGSEKAYELSLMYLNIAIEIYPTATYFVYRAQVNSDLKRWGKCILDCNQAITADPECYRAYLMRGAIKSVQLRQPNDGILDLLVAVDLAQDNEEKSNAYCELATAYYCKYYYGIDKSRYVLDTALKYANTSNSLYPNPTVQSVINSIKGAQNNYR